MFIYILLITLLVISHIIEINVTDKKSIKYIFIFMIIFLIFIEGLRSFDVGIDLETYQFLFEKYGKEGLGSFDLSQEPLYKIVNIAAYNIFFDFRSILFITAVMIFVPLANVILKYSKLPIFSLIMFIVLGFFTFSLSGLRQTIAIGITLLSYKHIRQRNFWKFLFIVLIAIGFHKSSLFFLAAYPIYSLRINKKNIAYVFILMIIIFIIRKPIFDSLYYFYDDTYQPVETGAFNFLFLLIGFYMVSIVSFGKSRDRNIVGLMNLILVAIIIQMFASYSTIVMRIGYFYYIYLIFLVPEQLHNFKDFNLRNVYRWSLIVFLVLMFFLSLETSKLQVYPYEFLSIYNKLHLNHVLNFNRLI